jgi:hypothetical protein
VEGVHNLVGEPDEAVYGVDGGAEARVEYPDAQGKGGAVPMGDQPAAFLAGVVVQFKHGPFLFISLAGHLPPERAACPK